MDRPAEIRHQPFRDRFFTGPLRREQIRGSMGIPLSAIAFGTCAFGTLASNVDLARWQLASLALIAPALLSLCAILAAAACLIRVEWLITLHAPPDLLELVTAEQRIRHALGDDAVPPEAAAVERHYVGVLVAAYGRLSAALRGQRGERQVPRLGGSASWFSRCRSTRRSASEATMTLWNLLFFRPGGARVEQLPRSTRRRCAATRKAWPGRRTRSGACWAWPALPGSRSSTRKRRRCCGRASATGYSRAGTTAPGS